MLLSQIEEVVKWNDWFKFLSPFELELIHFYSMSLMAFELYSQILQPLESPYDSCYVCDPNDGE